MAEENRPRHYAAEIDAMETREERRAALDRVPAHLRDMVRDHVVSARSLRRAGRA